MARRGSRWVVTRSVIGKYNWRETEGVMKEMSGVRLSFSRCAGPIAFECNYE